MSKEQFEMWNGPAGRAWVEQQDLLDGMYTAIQNSLVSVIQEGDRVLDVGCGTGSTTLAVADRVGASGRAIGIDISEPMIAHARQRAERTHSRATFLVANAETYPFEPGSHDVILSRFGVMFFDDPVRAFVNLHRSAAAAGRLRFAVWRHPSENPFMTAAERAVGHLLPNLPPRQPEAPGQFAFADPKKAASILERSEWRDVTIEPVDFSCGFPAAALERYVTRMGPVGLALQEVDPAIAAEVIALAQAAIARYRVGDEIRFDAACWLVAATAG